MPASCSFVYSSQLIQAFLAFTALRAYAISGRSTTLASAIFAFSWIPAIIGFVSQYSHIVPSKRRI